MIVEVKAAAVTPRVAMGGEYIVVATHANISMYKWQYLPDQTHDQLQFRKSLAFPWDSSIRVDELVVYHIERAQTESDRYPGPSESPMSPGRLCPVEAIFVLVLTNDGRILVFNSDLILQPGCIWTLPSCGRSSRWGDKMELHTDKHSLVVFARQQQLVTVLRVGLDDPSGGSSPTSPLSIRATEQCRFNVDPACSVYARVLCVDQTGCIWVSGDDTTKLIAWSLSGERLGELHFCDSYEMRMDHLTSVGFCPTRPLVHVVCGKMGQAYTILVSPPINQPLLRHPETNCQVTST